MRNITFIALSVFFSCAAIAQNPKVKMMVNQDNSALLYMDKESEMPYTVFISFNAYHNVKNRPAKEKTVKKFIVKDSDTPIVRLYPDNPQKRVGVSYSTSVMMGDLSCVTDREYIYMVPVSPNKEITFEVRGDASKQLYPLKGENIYEIRFNTEYGDTIYATRAGYAYNIKAQTDEQFAEKPIRNGLYLYHADGASTKYRVASMFKSFVVKEQYVRAGEPIGVVIKPQNTDPATNFKLSPEITLKVDAFFNKKEFDSELLEIVTEYMLNNNEFGPLKELYDKMNEDKEKFNTYLERFDDMRKCHFIPRFYISEGVSERIETTRSIKVEHPQSLIINEMGKKEKKAYLKHAAK